MPNKRYLKGKAKEQRVKQKFEAEGWFCTRSAGSHGIWDICCAHPEKREIAFIQCKPKKFSKLAKQRLLDKYNWLNGSFEARFEVI